VTAKPSEVYTQAMARVAELARNASDVELATQVPACPEWNVKELVAHLTGVAADSLAANVAEIGQAGWTQAQVDARKDLPLEGILEEWATITDKLAAGMNDIHPTLSSALIGDVITHELDLRGALGNTDARDGDGVEISTSFYARNFGKRLKDAGLPTLVVAADGNEWTAGREEPAGTVKASMFDMLRGLTGRRTRDEVEGFDWSIDAAPYLEVFSMYPVTQQSLNE
jgi:uncharacterized protein (TIGR03083 family)